jgi:methylthioxylose transferase
MLPGSQRSGDRGPGEAIVLGIVMVVAAATVVAGMTILASGGELGAGTPPFVAVWSPRLHPLALVSVGAAVAACVIAPRLLRPGVRPVAFAIAVYALTVALGLALNMARGGTAGWTGVFDLARPHEGANEYLAGLPSVGYGARFYLDRFAELVPSQPVHVAGHPPAPLLLLHLLGIGTAEGLAALCVGVGALAAPLTYRLGRTLRADREARIGALLLAFSPVVLLFGVTSFDYVFCALGAASAALLVARSGWIRGAGGLALALTALFSWALLAMGAWAAVVVARRDGLRAAVVLAAGCAASVAALNGSLAAAYGYDPIGTLQATEVVYRHSVAAIRPYGFWVLGSPVAWGVMLGVPIAAAWLRATVRGDPAAFALAVVLAAAALAGFTKAETERIWLIFVPLACVAAAPVIVSWRRPTVVALLAALAVQALAVEVLFQTIW